jgi:hypothetical protein
LSANLKIGKDAKNVSPTIQAYETLTNSVPDKLITFLLSPLRLGRRKSNSNKDQKYERFLVVIITEWENVWQTGVRELTQLVSIASQLLHSALSTTNKET